MKISSCWLPIVCMLLCSCDAGIQSTASYLPPTQAEHKSENLSTQLYEEPKPILESEPMVIPEPGVNEEVKASEPGNTTTPAIPVKLVRGNPATKKIALTFDDGPHEGFTEELVALLKSFNVKATFFMIGRNVQSEPDLAKLSFDSGIEIANHTFSHTRLVTLSDDDIRSELSRGANEIEKATGFRPHYYRPPGGEYDSRIEKITKELGMTMVLWTSDAGDYTTMAGNPSPEAISQKVLRYATPGGIVIMHDPMPTTLKALPNIITSLRARGFEFVTVSELASDPKAVFTGGPRIRPNQASAVQALVDPTRYPSTYSSEGTNANQEQRVATTPPPKGTKDQRAYQASQVGKRDEGKVRDLQTGESSGTKINQEVRNNQRSSR